MSRTRKMGFLALGVIALSMQAASAADVVRVGGGSLSDTVAKSKGLYAKYNLEVRSGSLGGSDAVRSGLAKGDLDIADYGVDNAIAMIEQMGADVVVVAGMTATPNDLIAQPEIKTLADLRGKTILVDAPDTQNALAMKKIVAGAGLKAGVDYQLKEAGGTPKRVALMRQSKENAATMSSPMVMLADKPEFTKLASSADTVGPLLAYAAYTRRDWAKTNEDVLVRYIAAHIEAQRWIMAPANKDAVVSMIAEENKVPHAQAERFYALNMTRFGWRKDVTFDLEGFRNVLKLRAEVEGTWGGTPPPAERYYDLSYHAKALKLVDKR
jgi:ABC-type nitrate/sulfonate/bicarbonate transport system substrate-binding protein